MSFKARQTKFQDLFRLSFIQAISHLFKLLSLWVAQKKLFVKTLDFLNQRQLVSFEIWRLCEQVTWSWKYFNSSELPTHCFKLKIWSNYSVTRRHLTSQQKLVEIANSLICSMRILARFIHPITTIIRKEPYKKWRSKTNKSDFYNGIFRFLSVTWNNKISVCIFMSIEMSSRKWWISFKLWNDAHKITWDDLGKIYKIWNL